ncbi:potassium-transporting ATPase subunit C [Mycobacterium sp. CBMA271]|uniref:potassium-transporting ATPase subunit C n=1 Tax=unclassified Mycobacteroides TaxID=2618759 RepID=UPI0012DC15D1|nr:MULTISPECIES: potassium-transporting ATPase subunit C [unclassified Mycobacteroides]MUM16761.1 K+-transporting ATPase subunit C [Mycobacteroides sp. CBMA 326]MUM20234.1 potassium-transporting ATPase subunit C [Mycobacteroides sp. CBMA 271]
MSKVVIAWLRQCVAGLVVLLSLTVVLGIAYPATVWLFGRIDSASAEGSPLTDKNGCVVGSAIIGVDPQASGSDPYFHTRASGDPAAGAPSNQGPNSEKLKADIDKRRATIAQRESVDPARITADAVTGSGSSLDPDITPEYAALQIPRVAATVGLSQARVKQLVDAHTSSRQWGILGEPRVNVPTLNVALGLTGPPCR